MKKFLAFSRSDFRKLAITLALTTALSTIAMVVILIGLQQAGVGPLPPPALLVLTTGGIGTTTGLFVYLRRELWNPLHQLFRSLPRRATQQANVLVSHGVAPVRLIAHRMNELLIQLQNRLSTSQSEINTLAHDLRGPLTRLMLRIESMQDQEQPDPQLITGLEADLNALLAIDQNLDQLAQMQQQTPDFEVLSLAQVCEAIKASYGSELVGLNVNADTELMADRRMLQRTIYNLIDNALEYGGAPVRISDSRSDHGVVITVEDTGHHGQHPTRPSHHHARLHHGIGLASARRFCMSHGGILEIGSSPLGGWRVDLVLGGMASPIENR